MALSGTINGTCYSYNGSSTNKYEYKIEWSATQNVGANTSTITAQSFVRSTSSSISTQSSNWVSKINGSQVWAGSWTVSGSWVSMGSRSWTVNHNADGTCTTNINGELTNGINFQDVYVLKRASASAKVTLNTIPRASSFTLNKTSGTIGSDTFVVTINKASSSFTHTVYYKFGSNTWTKADKTSATTVNVDVGIGDCNQLPNSTSGTATITVDTYNGSTKVGSASKTVTLNVPSNVVPTIDSVTATGNNLLGGIYVAGKSTVTAKINSASGAYGSTIKSYNISGAGISSSASSATSGALGAGDYTITGKVTDSRGRTASKSTKITVHSYYAPSVAIDLYRCDSAGKKSDSGTYARVAITPNIVNVGNANVNAKKYQVQWKAASSSSWSTLKDWADLSSYNSTFTCDLGGGWENTTTYNVKINVKDSYSTVSATGMIGTISCILNIEQKGIGIGKPYEQGGLDVKGAIYSNAVKVLTEDHPTSGNWWKGIPKVNTDGVMEVGKYIDFHNSNSSTADYDNRITSNGNTLEFSSNIKAAGSIYVRESRVAVQASHGGLDLGGTDRNTTICSKSAPAWWDGSTNRTLLHNSGHLYMNDGYNIITKNGSYFVNHDGDSSANGFVSRRYLDNKQQSAKLMVVNSGGGVAGMIHRNDTGGHETQLLLQTWGSGGSGCVRPGTTGACENGTSAYKWKFVCANNGTIQTSDERFKVKRGFANTDDCFEMVKNTELYKYIMLDKNKEDVSRNKLGKLAMECNGDEAKIHMGIMAQDVQKYECGKHILVEGEYEKEDGTTDTMLHINPLDMTMAVMGALKMEIQKRELLEEKITKLESLVEQLMTQSVK